MRELPKIISVDDHVIEPATVWSDRLPAKYRDIGPRIERRPMITSSNFMLCLSRYRDRTSKLIGRLKPCFTRSARFQPGVAIGLKNPRARFEKPGADCRSLLLSSA